MNIETLKYFQYIAKYKNITKASKHFFVSQSTLSRQIMALEEELGTKLFDRNNKSVELTEAGRTLYNKSDIFINHLETLVKEVVNANSGATGVLKIATNNNLFSFLSIPFNNVKQANPDMSFFIESYFFPEIPLSISHNIYDLGLTYDFIFANTDQNLEKLTIGTEHFVIAYPSKYKTDSREKTLASIMKNTSYISPNYDNPPFIDDMLLEMEKISNTKINHTISINSSESLIVSISMGLGYGILPLSWVELFSHKSNIDFLELDSTATSDVLLLWKKNTESKLIRIFVEAVKFWINQ